MIDPNEVLATLENKRQKAVAHYDALASDPRFPTRRSAKATRPPSAGSNK